MSASLKSEIPGGGIRSQHVEQDFADYVAGRPTTHRVVIGVLQTNSVSSENQTKGRVNKVKYEAVHLIEVRDPHEADQLRHRITQLRADAGLEVSQPTLFAATDAEQCEGLISLIRDWGSERDMGIEDLDKKWIALPGGGGERDNFPESFMACRSPQLLKDFAFELGVITDNPVKDEPEDAAPDETETEKEEAEPVAAGGIPFSEVTES